MPAYLTITKEPAQVLQKRIEDWNPDKIGILVDTNTKKYCYPLFSSERFPVIEIPAGEAHKNLKTCQHIWTELTKNGFTRHSLLINLGGGVIGDMGGFAASTFKRGIRFINIPTTLLSQVDASMGGKLAINFNRLKNHIGIFKDPDHVIVSPPFLSTLAPRILKSGFAEIIKHALIADKEQWSKLKLITFDNVNWEPLIRKSLIIKNSIIKKDPLEKGHRKILNFGHTLGHALESFFLKTHQPLLHGEAVAIGMIMESHLSLQKRRLTLEEVTAISSFIMDIYDLPHQMPAYSEIQEFLLHDKKNDRKNINFSLLKTIGKCSFDEQTTEEMIVQALSYYPSNK